jgi:hypothetical protein
MPLAVNVWVVYLSNTQSRHRCRLPYFTGFGPGLCQVGILEIVILLSSIIHSLNLSFLSLSSHQSLTLCYYWVKAVAIRGLHCNFSVLKRIDLPNLKRSAPIKFSVTSKVRRYVPGPAVHERKQFSTAILALSVRLYNTII